MVPVLGPREQQLVDTIDLKSIPFPPTGDRGGPGAHRAVRSGAAGKPPGSWKPPEGAAQEPLQADCREEGPPGADEGSRPAGGRRQNARGRQRHARHKGPLRVRAPSPPSVGSHSNPWQGRRDRSQKDLVHRVLLTLLQLLARACASGQCLSAEKARRSSFINV